MHEDRAADANRIRFLRVVAAVVAGERVGGAECVLLPHEAQELLAHAIPFVAPLFRLHLVSVLEKLDGGLCAQAAEDGDGRQVGRVAFELLQQHGGRGLGLVGRDEGAPRAEGEYEAQGQGDR